MVIIMNTAQSTKNLAQTVAKQAAQAPWEILKEAGNQVFPQETQTQTNPSQNQNPEQAAIENNKLLEERDRVRSRRLMQALQTELEEIKRKKEQEKAFKLQQEQIAEDQKENAKNVNDKLVEPAVKKGRRLFNFGKKIQMQRQQTQTERPLPPSG